MTRRGVGGGVQRSMANQETTMKRRDSMTMAMAAATIAALLATGAAQAQDVGVTATEILLGEVQPMSGPAALIDAAVDDDAVGLHAQLYIGDGDDRRRRDG